MCIRDRLAVAGFIVPFIFIYSPELLLTGDIDIMATVFSFFVTGLGLLFLCAAVEGALIKPVAPYVRVAFAIIALLLIWPDVLVSLIGLVAVSYTHLDVYKRQLFLQEVHVHCTLFQSLYHMTCLI